MPRETSNRLVEYARDQINGALRSVVVVNDDDYDVVYLRENLEDNYTPTRFENVIDSFRIDLGVRDYGDGDTQIGEKQALIHQHTNAFVFQFPHPDCHSILLSVDPKVGSRLRSFVSECQERL